MKQAITRIASFVLVCFLFFGATAYQPPVVDKATYDTYTGYWVVKSGEDFMIMSEAKIPEAAYQMDAKGEFKSINREMVANTLRFENRSSVNGKQIDANFFVITKAELDKSTRSVMPASGKALPSLTTYDLRNAYMFCTGVTVTGWGGAQCNGTRNYCTAIKISTGESVYIMCDNY